MQGISDTIEWLEADGQGGFASGTTSGIRTRRYHALLLTATRPPAGRVLLVNGLEAEVELNGQSYALSSHRYLPGVTHPDGISRLVAFEPNPWPRWTWHLADGIEIEHELFTPREAPAVVLAWRLKGTSREAMLRLRLLLSGRDPHALQRENPAFRFDAREQPGRVLWQPYPDHPAVALSSNGSYQHEPQWHRQFLYSEERARGLDSVEDLGSPGVLRFALGRGPAWCVLEAGADAPRRDVESLRRNERMRRSRLGEPRERASRAYLVRRGRGSTVIAGYPWFGDWGRDTFIALRGLSLATGRLEEARAILVEWAGAVSEGMLPNRFPDQGETAEYNSVDASLWYAVAVHELVAAYDASSKRLPQRDRRTLGDAVQAILEAYSRGTRFGIVADGDGLLRAGVPGLQLTWMDARVGDRVVTARIGKPVEVQALWLNALKLFAPTDRRWGKLFEAGSAAFASRFWSEEHGHLYDVIDVDHRPGRDDPTFRPNQLLALGGLPLALVEGRRARRMLDAIEERLLTPAGIRSLAPGEPGYCPRYEGGVAERDSAYHQGPVWPWLVGPFVEAWLRVHGQTARGRAEARRRFLEPLLATLDPGNTGHLPELADAEPPWFSRGCPFPAWSLSEVLRLERVVLAGRAPSSKA